MPINSFQYRRETPESAAEPRAEMLYGDTGDWEDNWISSFIARASRVFLPSWCDAPGYWTSRFMQCFHTSCPCCLSFRGIAIRLAFGSAVGLTAAALF